MEQHLIDIVNQMTNDEKAELFALIIMSIPAERQYLREDIVGGKLPDTICPDCFQNMEPGGRYWSCYESPAYDPDEN